MQQRGNIEQYTSPIDGLRPDSNGDQALARAGRIDSEFYDQEGRDYKGVIDSAGGAAAKVIDDHETMSDIGQGSAALAAMHNNVSATWDKVISQPGAAQDKSIQGTFLNDTLEPQLQSWQNGFTTEAGQKWALAQADSMRMQYTEKTSADMSALAGVAVKQNLTTQLNQLSATSYRDATTTDANMAQVDAYIAAAKQHGNLTAEGLAQVDAMGMDEKNELAKSTIKGLADNTKNPLGIEQAAHLLASGTYDAYLPKDEQSQLHDYIDEQARRRQEMQTIGQLQQERAQKLQSEAVATDLFNKSYNPQTGDFSFTKENLSAIMSNPTLPASTKMNIEGMVKKIAQDSAINDPDTVKSNFTALGSGTLTQDQLLAQGASGKLSPEGFTFWNERLSKTPDAVAEKSALSNAVQQVQKTILTTPAPGLPPSDTQRQNETKFTNWFMPAYNSALNDPAFKGMTQSQKAQILLSSTDPKGLLTPEKMAPFLTSPQQMLADGLKGVGPLPSAGGATGAPAKPSPTDITYIKANKNNPAWMAAYDQQFGKGAAARDSK